MTPDARYAPGDALGLVWPGGVVVLDASVDAGVAATAWSRLSVLPPSTPLETVLTELADATGARLLQMPSFAIAVCTGPGEAQVAVRGSFAVTVTVEDSSPIVVSGTGVTTWSERRLTAASVISIRSEGGEGRPAVSWPIASGVVAVGMVTVDVRSTAAGSPDPAAEDWPTVRRIEPAPEPELEAAVDSNPVGHLEPVDGEVPSEDMGAADNGGFEDVWADFTVAGSVESAAVRPSGEPVVSRPLPDVVPSPTPEITWLEDEHDSQQAHELQEVREAESPELPDPPHSRLPKTPTLAPPPDFISEVPGMAAPAATPPVVPPVAPPPLSGADTPRAAVLGDHGGDTVAGLPIPGLPAPGTPMSGSPTGVDSGLLGVLCPTGHSNPPQRALCRVCGNRLVSAPTRIPQPSLGRIVVSSGERMELTGPIIIGRAPRAARFQGTEIPRLMTLQQPHISANHLALRLEGWSVLAVDLNSTNGTFLRRNGEPPFRLLEQAQLLVPGDVIDLGHGVHLRFEELP